MLAAADISNKKHKNKEKGFYFHRNPRIFVKIGNIFNKESQNGTFCLRHWPF